MKKLSVLALALFAATAFAHGPSAPTEVNISGTSVQAALFDGSAVVNRVTDSDNIGQQNLASNAGDVNISGNSLQLAFARNSVIWNDVSGNDNVASQNMSSNVGVVDVSGTSIQITAANNSAIMNVVSGRDNSGTQTLPLTTLAQLAWVVTAN